LEFTPLYGLYHIIDAAREKSSDAESFLRLVKTYTDNKKLNAEIIRTFNEKVYVYQNEKRWDRNTKKIKVIFNFIGEVHIPSNVKPA
jgi:site-specific DNA recombinase